MSKKSAFLFSHFLLYAKNNGIDLSALRARQFQVNDFDVFDKIFVMDKSNLHDVLSLAKNEAHKNKVKLFLNEIYKDSHTEVPDPYFGTEKDFEAVFQLIYKACEELSEKIQKELNS